jgi:L-iditol 2-dehydrogenase
MKQAVMLSPGSIEYREVPIPKITDQQVLVNIKRIGVCGSDIHVFHGRHPYTSYPVVQGHEVSGVVDKLGAEVSGISPGDKVTIEPQVSCGKCFPCTHGLYNICNHLKVLGFQTTGTASDYFVVDAKKLVKLPESIGLNEGAMIEPLAVGIRAIQKGGNITGLNVLVFGAGPIGNLVAQSAKAMGASAVMIADINNLRLKVAESCGIDFTINPMEEDLEKVVASRFGRERKADLIIECAGVSETLGSAILNARKGSSLIVVAVYGEKPVVDMAMVNENELSIIGTARYNIDDFRTAIELVKDKKITLGPLVTDEFDFLHYEEAYLKIQNNPESTMKVIIKVND